MEINLPVLGFAAFSGTGKTTLLKKLIPQLSHTGLSVAVVKHAHHQFEIDIPGKDSYELRHAGAKQVLISSKRRFVEIKEVEQEKTLDQCLAQVDSSLCDLILVEGFKHASIKKIELHRPSLGLPLLYEQDKNIIALASDSQLDKVCPLPTLDLNNIEEIAEFIIRFMAKPVNEI